MVFKTQIREVQRQRHQVRRERFNKTIPEVIKRQGKGRKLDIFQCYRTPVLVWLFAISLFITYIICTRFICFNKPLCASTCYRHLRSQMAANTLFECRERWELITSLGGLFYIYTTTDVRMVISLESKSDN